MKIVNFVDLPNIFVLLMEIFRLLGEFLIKYWIILWCFIEQLHDCFIAIFLIKYLIISWCTKALHMVNHTKLIHALTLSSLCNHTKRWLSIYLKGRTASCRYNFTLSPFFHARVWVPQGSCISPTLFNLFISTFPQSDNLVINSYADDFTASCSNSNAYQMTEWAEERGLAISAPKLTISLFTPQFTQSHP